MVNPADEGMVVSFQHGFLGLAWIAGLVPKISVLHWNEPGEPIAKSQKRTVGIPLAMLAATFAE